MISNSEKKRLVYKQYIIKKLFFTIIFFILIACNTNNTTNNKNNIIETITNELSHSSYKDESGFLTIPVNVNQNVQLSLTDIAEDIKKVELEISDLLKGRIKIIYSESYIVLLAAEYIENKPQITVFDNNGKFKNHIGNSGKGKGQYGTIFDIVTDFKNKKIYVSTLSKIICYDIEGNFINESPLIEMVYLSIINNKLFSFADRMEAKDGSKHKIRNMIYEINDKLNISDSIEIRNIDLINPFYVNLDDRNYLTCMGDETYLFHPVNMPNSYFDKPIVNDTLYIFKNKTLIPHLRLDLGDKVENRMIDFICKNSRFVFAKHTKLKSDYFNYFCYDMKENKGFNMRNGFMDNIHTQEVVEIRPIDYDANKFYYLRNNIMRGNNNEKLNLTLYVGTFKK